MASLTPGMRFEDATTMASRAVSQPTTARRGVPSGLARQEPGFGRAAPCAFHPATTAAWAAASREDRTKQTDWRLGKPAPGHFETPISSLAKRF